ncbi:MAG: hypothetical protein HYT42_01525 [Candidatus Sungbacteria bacterium]|nr:hypothetical protein [Candidatus Sungbacteria bacterium]
MNNGVIPGASGIGKQSFSLALDFPVEEKISAFVRDGGGEFAKTVSVNIGPVGRSVGIYELRPLYGVVFEKRVPSYSAPAGESRDFVAEAFFFPLDRKPDLSYRWSFNNQEITGDFDQPWLFTIRSNRGETSLDNQLDLELSDPAKGSERALTSTRISFR